MAELTMPILGADMEAGTLVAWRIAPGDRVQRGAIVAEVETEKGIIEIEVFTAGTVERLLVDPGAKVPVGTPLALIREDEAGAPRPPRAAPPTARPAAPSPPPIPPPSSAAPGGAPPPTRGRVSPAARRRAHDLGIDPGTLAGSGPSGAVTLDDVERAAAGRAPGVRAAAMSPMRRAIAAAMGRSKREIPHFYLDQTIALRPALAWLERENAQRPVAERLLPGALFVKAVALALHEFPELNARWSPEGPVPMPAVNVGVAIALRDGGLIAPAIHGTDALALVEVMRRLRDVVARARSGGLRSSELSEPSITVTSLGDQGVERVSAVIFPPQVAIVGFGAIVTRPWVEGGAVVPAPVVTVTLAADHRVTDGHRAARFLLALERLLQAPEAL
jgi:pyruvate dehydrogenase E2 component (dihydrolipoamide acetyltransferase)